MIILASEKIILLISARISLIRVIRGQLEVENGTLITLIRRIYAD